MSKTITIDPVTRIEGHARVQLNIDDTGAIKTANLIVNELRGFERILVGMQAEQIPQVTARICGVCPAAHHLASVKALDSAAGVIPPPAALMLRELLYMGHFIHSHILSLFVLSGPDLVFGLDGDPLKRNIVGVVEAAPDVAKKALRVRTLGQKITEEIGGRGVHPVTAVAGGLSYRLSAEQRVTLEKWVDECLTLGTELAKFAKGLFVKLIQQHPVLTTKLVEKTYYMGTVKNGKVNFYDGQLRVMDPDGRVTTEFDVKDYDRYLTEQVLHWSYMKPVYLMQGGANQTYRVNALARINCTDGMETPLAQAELETFRIAYGRPCHITVMHIYARVIELIYAIERAKALVSNPAILGETQVPVKFPGGRGVGHVEAPRGTLIHDYEIDEKGIVRSANLIVATQQNYAAINQTIRQAADSFVAKRGDRALLNAVEFGIRCYDPCLSCATHAIGRMPIQIELWQGGTLIREIRRDD